MSRSTFRRNAQGFSKSQEAPVPAPDQGPHETSTADEYLGHLAHDLRASLHTILGWAELLRTRSFDDAGRVRAAETILRHARQQLWLVNDVIDASRLLSGTLRLNVGPVDLRDVVESAAQAVEPIAAARQLELSRELTPLHGHVQGDAQRLKQAIVAVLTNAMHFMTSAGTVAVRLAPSPDGAELTVRASGVGSRLGVGAAEVPHLSARRPPTAAGRASQRDDLGVRLGLVRDLLDLHGGSIHVTRDESGITFRLSLPLGERLRVAPVGTTLIARDGPTDHSKHSRLLGLTVLVVDDEADAREIVAGILRHYGAVVVAAASVAEAFTVLGRERVDVLLTDIAMPGQDGYDLIRRMQHPDSLIKVPTAALTAFASEVDRRHALDAGFQAHLSKPIDPHVLVETVATLARRGGRATSPGGRPE